MKDDWITINRNAYIKAAPFYFNRSHKYELADRGLLGHFLLEQFLLRPSVPVPTILDLGCGTCRRAKIMRNTGASVTVLDFCPPFIRYAKRNGFECIDAEFKTAEIDLSYHHYFTGVHCGSFLHQFPPKDIPFILNKIKQLLQPGGFLFVGEPIEKENKGWQRVQKDIHSQEYHYKTIQIRDWWIRRINRFFTLRSLIMDVDVIAEGKYWWNGVWQVRI
jgi:SAM-dependent methyltransferase